MKISPISNYQIMSNNYYHKQPSFSANPAEKDAVKTVAKGGFLATIAAIIKEIKDIFNSDNYPDDMPKSELDIDLEIKTARDMIP